ncbi:MAG: hypothetical protein KAY24_12510 [Candidatus Eisenbacteria sp.]|nr:hypothetical protein [Candidatus Eisenbacteria bacterium]
MQVRDATLPSATNAMHRACPGWLLLIAAATAVMTLASGFAGTASSDSGAQTGAFANLEPGGRGTGLAGALGPIVDSPTALHWNPVRLLHVTRPEIEVTYADLFGLGLVRHTGVFLACPRYSQDISWKDGKITVAPGAPTSAWGLGIQSTMVDLDPESYTEHDLALGFAARGRWGLSIGVVGHLLLVRSDVDQTEADGYAFDLALSSSMAADLEASLVLRSIFSGLNWEDSDRETLAQRAHMGLGYAPFATVRLPLEAIWDLERGRCTQVAGAVEWFPASQALTLRGGLRWRDDGSESQLFPATGLGLAWKQIAFNYGFTVGREELGDTHRLDLRYRF